MTTIIDTLLASDKVFPSAAGTARGGLRHAYNELVDLNTRYPTPALASPYLQAAAVSTVSATTNASTGNFTITLNFPKYGVAVTTANIAFDAAEAAIQTAIDNALADQVLVDTYNAGDVVAKVTGNISANAATITANGATVLGAHLVVTTANVDLDADEIKVTANTIGTQNRPAEAILAKLGVVAPTGSVTAQGTTPAEGSYALGDNPFSVSPGLRDLLLQQIEMGEDAVLGRFLKSLFV